MASVNVTAKTDKLLPFVICLLGSCHLVLVDTQPTWWKHKWLGKEVFVSLRELARMGPIQSIWRSDQGTEWSLFTMWLVVGVGSVAEMDRTGSRPNIPCYTCYVSDHEWPVNYLLQGLLCGPSTPVAYTSMWSVQTTQWSGPWSWGMHTSSPFSIVRKCFKFWKCLKSVDCCSLGTEMGNLWRSASKGWIFWIRNSCIATKSALPHYLHRWNVCNLELGFLQSSLACSPLEHPVLPEELSKWSGDLHIVQWSMNCLEWLQMPLSSEMVVGALISWMACTLPAWESVPLVPTSSPTYSTLERHHWFLLGKVSAHMRLIWDQVSNRAWKFMLPSTSTVQRVDAPKSCKRGTHTHTWVEDLCPPSLGGSLKLLGSSWMKCQAAS